ncbi:GNAT family N-acetyltransferase [Hymenobacter cellulosilyticus]|uniref:GNAT family N-acetyltransferase n=1 Tax=Hymenobacter cellulosilyticus TaxID=2932248 RepID=A0A8T9Q3C1_9BACT|nr:GNAT family N-acetyltransferase [Hymenobacter cellulosilyticus]UOQ71472.1 GNAT family N-acetyltransferase [Hymenobacter cellulosilyticus]
MPTLALPARRLEPADLVWATALLETCAADHPVLNHCCTAADARSQKVWLLKQLLRFGLRYGRVYANADANALAVWVGPNHPAATLYQLLRTGLLPAALWRLDWTGFQRLRHFLVATAWLRRHSAEAHSHYLLALAVQPGARGQGRGRRLLQASLSAMQATHAPCYLDVQRPAELGFFQQQGFRLAGQCPAGRGPQAPTNWGLVREGRA